MLEHNSESSQNVARGVFSLKNAPLDLPFFPKSFEPIECHWNLPPSKISSLSHIRLLPPIYKEAKDIKRQKIPTKIHKLQQTHSKNHKNRSYPALT